VEVGFAEGVDVIWKMTGVVVSLDEIVAAELRTTVWLPV
jgi:hypothetical protein